MNNQKKTVLLITLVVGVIAMTIAFAALSTRLSINGTASVPDVSWNIHFQNWTNNTQETANGHTNTADYPDADDLTKTLSPNITKVEGLDVTLYQPGDYVSYKFQIINEGSIDASLSNFSHNLTCASGNDCSHLSYEVACTDNANGGNNVLVTNATLEKDGGLAYCTLTVTYTDTTNQNSGNAGSNQVYEKSAASATLDATWVYVQKVDSNSGSGGNSGSGSSSQTLGMCDDGATSFAGEVGYDGPGAATCGNGGNSRWVAEANPEWNAYYYNNGTAIQVCVKYSGGTVCLDGNPNGYESDFENCDSENMENNVSCLKGYTKTKVDEMIAKGASCGVSYSHEVTCRNSNEYPYCDISESGGVHCYGSDDSIMYSSCDFANAGYYCGDHLE